MNCIYHALYSLLTFRFVLVGWFISFMVSLVGSAETNCPVYLYRVACAFIILHAPVLFWMLFFTHSPLKFTTWNKQRGIRYFELEKSMVCIGKFSVLCKFMSFSWLRKNWLDWYPWKTSSHKLINICYIQAGSSLCWEKLCLRSWVHPGQGLHSR